MEMNGQMEHSVKSEMSNWTKQFTYQLTAEQIQAVENNDISKFKTTSGGKETMTQIWKEKPFGDYFGQKYAESYDEAAWFRARCAFLEYRNYELEEQLCDVCNVSMKNEGGCDCQIIACACCGEEGHKYNHNLGEDGLLRCDECEEEESEEEDCDPYDPMRRIGNNCQSSDCENKLTTEHECRALMCLSCIEQWRIHDEEEMRRFKVVGAVFDGLLVKEEVCGEDDFRCEDCTYCARTRVCGDCGCVGGCYPDCVNVLA